METYKSIQGYEGIYWVSNKGNVKNASNRIRKFKKNKFGYLRMVLSKGGMQKTYFVHRLVANAFVEGYREGLEVNHIDGCKANNDATNLEWVTKSENKLHSIRIGLVKNFKLPPTKGVLNGRAILNEDDVREIRKMFTNKVSVLEISKKYGIAKDYVYLVAYKKTWKHVV